MRPDEEKLVRIGRDKVLEQMMTFRATLVFSGQKLNVSSPLEIRLVGLYDAVNLDKVCTAARIKPWLFGVYFGDVAEWLKAAVC